ncbi:MAG: DUF2141 domain-containing protein [Pacificimonas sp.]
MFTRSFGKMATAITTTLTASVLMTAAPAPAQAAAAVRVLGPNPAACNAGSDGAAALVRVHGFKDRKGQVRVQVYPGDPKKFLEKGEWIERVDVPLTRSGDMDVCVKLPAPGDYAMVVMHDRGKNGKLDPFSDGAGLPGNPDMKLAKPDYDMANFRAKPGVTPMTIVLNYRRGLLGFGPVGD